MFSFRFNFSHFILSQLPHPPPFLTCPAPSFLSPLSAFSYPFLHTSLLFTTISIANSFSFSSFPPPSSSRPSPIPFSATSLPSLKYPILFLPPPSPYRPSPTPSSSISILSCPPPHIFAELFFKKYKYTCPWSVMRAKALAVSTDTEEHKTDNLYKF